MSSIPKSYIPVYQFTSTNEKPKKKLQSTSSFLRKAQSVESVLEDKTLKLLTTDDSKETYKANLRKSMDSVSNRGSYDPVYKNYRYQPQFKSQTAWASTQRHLPTANSETDVNKKSYSSYRYSGNFTYRNSLDGDTLPETSFIKKIIAEADADSNPSNSFKPKVQSVHYKDNLIKAEYEEEDAFDQNNLNSPTEDIVAATEKQVEENTAEKPISQPVLVLPLPDPKPAPTPAFRQAPPPPPAIIIPPTENSTFVDDKLEQLKTNMLGDMDASSTDSKLEEIDLGDPSKALPSDTIQNGHDSETIAEPVKQPGLIIPNGPVQEVQEVEPKVEANGPVTAKKSGKKKTSDEENKKLGPFSWKWKKKQTSFKGDKGGIKLEELDTYKFSHVPEFLVVCLRRLNEKDLLTTKGLYELSSNAKASEYVKNVMKKVTKDKDYTEIQQSTDGVMITSLIKYFFKHLNKPLLKSDLFDEKLKDEFFKDKLTLNELDDEMLDVLREMINGLEEKAREVLLYFIFHLAEIEYHKDENFLDFPNISRLISPCLYSNASFANFDQFILSSNQSLLLQVILENYSNIFDQEFLQEVELTYKTSLFEEETLSRRESVETLDSIVGRKHDPEKQFNLKSSLTNIANKFKAQPVPIIRLAPEMPDTGEVYRNFNDGTGDQNPIEENFSFSWNKRVNIENVTKQRGTNIPELVYSIVQSLTINKLYKTENIYAVNMNLEEMEEFVKMVKRRDEDEIKRFDNGNHLAFFLKEYIKLFQPSLLDDTVPDFEIYKKMTNDIAKLHLEDKKYSEYINWIEPIAAKHTFMFLIKHLNDVAKDREKNHMTPYKLAQIWSQCLFPAQSTINYKNVEFLEYSIMHYKKLFNENDLKIIQDIYKSFYDIVNLPFPASKDSTQKCCVIA